MHKDAFRAHKNSRLCGYTIVQKRFDVSAGRRLIRKPPQAIYTNCWTSYLERVQITDTQAYNASVQSVEKCAEVINIGYLPADCSIAICDGIVETSPLVQ